MFNQRIDQPTFGLRGLRRTWYALEPGVNHPSRYSRPRLPRVGQPSYPMEYQVDAKEESEHPKTRHWKARQNDKASQHPEYP